MRKLKVTELNRLTPEAFKESKKIPLIVVLDHIRSLNNVGSVFRTSDAFRVEAIYLCGITACPPNAEIHQKDRLRSGRNRRLGIFQGYPGGC